MVLLRVFIFFAAVNASADSITFSAIDPETGRVIWKTVDPDSQTTVFIGNNLLQKSRPSERPWSLSVSSTYRDESTNRPVTISGGGTLVLFKPALGPERYFVQTVAHVSQGENVKVAGIPDLKVVRRFHDNLADVEFLEVVGSELRPEMALAEFDSRAQKFFVAPAWADGWSILALSNVHKSKDALFVPGSSRSIGSTGAIVLPKNSATVSEAPTRLDLSAGGNDIVANSSVASGDSGHALILKGYDDKMIERWVLAGTVARSSRFFSQSFFPSANLIAQIFKRQVVESKLNDPFSWRLKNGLTYRAAGNKLAEVVDAETKPTGNGADRDGGNGADRDGGDGLTDAALSPEQVWDRYKIKPGILWEGKPTMALKVGDGVLYADTAALLLLNRQLDDSIQVSAIPPGTNFLELVRKRLTLTGATGRAHFDANNYLEIKETELLVTLFDTKKKEKIQFRLDSFGRLPGKDRFYPVVRIEGGRGNYYNVDLRSLFFTSVSGARPEKIPAWCMFSAPKNSCKRLSSDYRWSAADLINFINDNKAPSITFQASDGAPMSTLFFGSRTEDEFLPVGDQSRPAY